MRRLSTAQWLLLLTVRNTWSASDAMSSTSLRSSHAKEFLQFKRVNQKKPRAVEDPYSQTSHLLEDPYSLTSHLLEGPYSLPSHMLEGPYPLTSHLLENPYFLKKFKNISTTPNCWKVPTPKLPIGLKIPSFYNSHLLEDSHSLTSHLLKDSSKPLKGELCNYGV